MRVLIPEQGHAQWLYDTFASPFVQRRVSLQVHISLEAGELKSSRKARRDRFACTGIRVEKQRYENRLGSERYP